MRKAIVALLFVAGIGFAQDFGFRSGLGVSALRGHKALQSLAFGPNAVRLYPAFSASVGFAFAVDVFALELQYTLYQAMGELEMVKGGDFSDLYEAGVRLHSLEMPLLARFDFGRVYVEVGPQFGANIYAKIYMNNEVKKPIVNVFTVGPSFGVGIIKAKDLLLGLRGHFGMVEYAERTNGYPWAVQIGMIKFI